MFYTVTVDLLLHPNRLGLVLHFHLMCIILIIFPHIVLQNYSTHPSHIIILACT